MAVGYSHYCHFAHWHLLCSHLHCLCHSCLHYWACHCQIGILSLRTQPSRSGPGWGRKTRLSLLYTIHAGEIWADTMAVVGEQGFSRNINLALSTAHQTLFSKSEIHTSWRWRKTQCWVQGFFASAFKGKESAIMVHWQYQGPIIPNFEQMHREMKSLPQRTYSLFTKKKQTNHHLWKDPYKFTAACLNFA